MKDLKRISKELPKPYKTVLITDDGGTTFKTAYRVFSEKTGNLWIDAKTDEFYFLSEYSEWKYENTK